MKKSLNFTIIQTILTEILTLKLKAQKRNLMRILITTGNQNVPQSRNRDQQTHYKTNWDHQVPPHYERNRDGNQLVHL
ncbi:hypothetical protein GE061_006289 [Apolygus lucorum]|uniref:Uncharacterized protein n=1 Tax=Apolygus lucorum TaxID=248454 RepID=A0A8S9WSS7_APOLU|nr:hypothetical protein GE061_006289 [Apolygus lucorum]